MNRSRMLIAVGVVFCLLLSYLVVLMPANTARADPADSPWPMFGQNPQRTGQSPYTGPEVPYLRWSFSTGNWPSSPSIGTDGTIYVGSYDRNLYAINPDGSEKWRFSAGDLIPTSTSVSADGTIYVGSYNNHISGIPNANLYAIDPDGTEKWRFDTGGRYSSSPAIAMDGTIYVGSDDKNLYALNPDGSEKWRFNTGDLRPTLATIAADGTIFIGAGDLRVAPRSNAHLYAIYPDGTEKWSFTTASVFVSHPVVADDITYVGSGGILYAINPDGTEKWRFATGGQVSSPYISPTIGTDGTLYFGSQYENLYAIDPDGTEKWRFAIRDQISTPTIGADGTLYFGSQDNNLYAINPDGTEKWRFATGNRVYSPSIGADGTLYFRSLDNKVFAVGEAPEGYVFAYLVNPSTGATNVDRTSIGFTWNALGEAESFDLVLSSKANLADPVEIKEGLTTTAYTSVTTLEYETTYYWQVKAWRDDNLVGQSEISTFTTRPKPPDVGVKAGDWIRVEYDITGWPPMSPHPEWLKLEFLTVEGTSVTVLATMSMSDGTQETDTVPVIIGGTGGALGLSGFVIGANLTTGDPVYMTGYGYAELEGETTETYAGADRTVVYTSFAQHGVHLTYSWDKQTGVLVKTTTGYSGITMTATATETNMWEPASIPVSNGGTTPVSWWLWVTLAAVAGAAAAVYLKRRKKRAGAST